MGILFLFKNACKAVLVIYSKCLIIYIPWGILLTYLMIYQQYLQTFKTSFPNLNTDSRNGDAMKYQFIF